MPVARKHPEHDPGDKTMHRRHFLQAGAAVSASLAAPALLAADWPSQPVRIIVGFPPGGGTDVLARVLGVKLTEMWKQQVIVENKAGVAGVLAAEYVAQQPNDGYTLLMAHINSHALAPSLQPKLRYSVERDFTPIMLVGVTPNLLIANKAQAAKTVPDIVAACKARPGQVSFGSAGAGSAQHLALEMFKLRAKVDALHIPYKGSGPLLQDLIGGQIQYSFETMTAATPHVKSGNVLAIAQTRTKRAKGHPTVPTMAELGFEGFDATTWYGLAGPGKLSPAIVARINRDANAVLALPDVQDKFDTYGAEDGGGSPEKFAEFIRSETAKWAKVAKDADVKIDS
jgi:tripartite-type tricarboxylate transporter receptor subunit TctC